MNFFHFSLGFLSSGLLGFYFTKNTLGEGLYHAFGGTDGSLHDWNE
jgi:hypothetical protein